jgi:hypothetical protein
MEEIRNELTLTYATPLEATNACAATLSKWDPWDLYWVDSSEFDIDIKFDHEVRSYSIDKKGQNKDIGGTHSLMAGNHAIRYAAQSGMVNKRKFHVSGEDTITFKVKNLRLTMSPTYSAAYIGSEWTSNFLGKFSLQSALHDFFLAVGYGGGKRSYVTTGGGYRFAIRPHRIFYFTIGANAYLFIT